MRGDLYRRGAMRRCIGFGRSANTNFLADLLAVVGRAYLLENEASPSSPLSRISKSSCVGGCNKQVRERLKKSIL